MSEPVVAQAEPYETELVAGEKYFWCACGLERHPALLRRLAQGHRHPPHHVHGGGKRDRVALRLQADREPAALRRHPQHALSARLTAEMTEEERVPAPQPRGRARSVLAAALLVGTRRLQPVRAIRSPCPKVSVLKQTSQLTLYGDGPGRDDANVAFALEMRGVAADCDHDVDDEEGGGVEVDIRAPHLRDPRARGGDGPAQRALLRGDRRPRPADRRQGSLHRADRLRG